MRLRANGIIWCNYAYFIICNRLICLLLIGGQQLGLLSHDRIEDILSLVIGILCFYNTF
jgi:hypothetical protein